MERENDTSSFFVPSSMQDFTIMTTPLPRAASTATKRQSTLLTEDPEIVSLEKFDEDLKKQMAEFEAERRLTLDENKSIGQMNKQTSLKEACKNVDDMQKKVSRELAEARAVQERVKSSKIPVSSSSSKLPYVWTSEFDLQDEGAMEKFLGGSKNPSNSSRLTNEIRPPFSKNSVAGNQERNIEKTEQVTKDFEFLVPCLPVKRSDKSYLDMSKKIQKDPITFKKDGKDVQSKISDNHSNKHRVSEIPRMEKHYSNELPEKRSSSLSSFKTPMVPYLEDDRISISSSADSSLGILSLDALEDFKEEPLTEFSEQDKLDLSERLAKELQLDTSHLRDSVVDISLLASARMKETLSARSEENKENKNKSEQERHSSDYFTLRGYSSDNSGNNTAKEFSKLSLNSIGENELPVKESSLLSKKKPLSERNSASSRNSFISKSASSGRLSFQSSEGWNPFGDNSKVSVGSEEFQSGEDVVEKLKKDEEMWRGEFNQSQRSLSGIYGDGDFSFRSHGDKLSMSSFLRSGSGPLGCLEKAGDDRPTFGLPVVSPEKKTKPRGILPPPEEKLTFVLDEVPTKDTKEGDPWDPHSLVEQFSLVHGQEDSEDSDVSVPSLSCIGELLSEAGEGIDPRQFMDKLMEASRKRSKKTSSKPRREASVITIDDSCASISGKQNKPKTISAVVSGGNNSFCRGYESDRSTRYSSSFNSHITLDEEPVTRPALPPARQMASSVITIDDSLAPSVCNVTDFEGDEEEYVCVMTPESMDFDIFNDFERAQHYFITKACYVNGLKQDSAAFVHLPVTSLTLQPGDKQVVSVTVAALVAGTIKVKIEVIRTDSATQQSELNTVYGKIIAEIPKISVLSRSPINLKPVVDGRGGEFFGEYQEVIDVKNSGRSIVPVKLTLSEENSDSTFCFDQNKSKSVTFRVEPGQTYKQKVYCQTPAVFEVSNAEGCAVTAHVDVFLATPTQAKLPPLSNVSLSAQLSSNFFCAPPSLLVPSDGPVPCKLYNSGTQRATIHAKTSANYTVQPSIVTIQPLQSVTFMVNTLSGFRSGTLTLYALETHSNHIVNLRGTSTSGSSSSCFVTPQTSRSTSPTSPCSASRGLGALQVTCTHKELVWGGCALQQKVVKTCTLKNLSNYREKLLLKVTDQHHCFKLVNEKKGLEQEMKLSLQPMENRLVSVVILAGSTGPKWGHLTISRINSPLDKKVLPLYAFGGKAKVNIEGIMQDPEQRMWLYLDPDHLCSVFTLTNNGDYSAFVKISGGMSATSVVGGLSIVPPECILAPDQSVSVEISLSVTPERLEHLLAQSSQAICVTRLTVTHGDESTRLRLSRLSRIHPSLTSKMSTLTQLLPVAPIPHIEKLDDPFSSTENLWVEDISEWTVGVLVKRSALEALRLDSSFQFVDLATTVIHQ